MPRNLIENKPKHEITSWSTQTHIDKQQTSVYVCLFVSSIRKKTVVSSRYKVENVRFERKREEKSLFLSQFNVKCEFKRSRELGVWPCIRNGLNENCFPLFFLTIYITTKSSNWPRVDFSTHNCGMFLFKFVQRFPFHPHPHHLLKSVFVQMSMIPFPRQFLVEKRKTILNLSWAWITMELRRRRRKKSIFVS